MPCEECNQKVKRAAIDYKWREIYPAVCNVLEMDPLSSCELGEKFDLKKDKDIRLGSQGDSTKTTIKVSDLCDPPFVKLSMIYDFGII